MNNEIILASSKVLDLKNGLDLTPTPIKTALDRFLHKQICKNPYRRREVNEKKVVCGQFFAQTVLPFCNPFYSSRSATLRDVPSEQVLAGMYRNYSTKDSASATSIADIMDKCSENDGYEAAHYIQIGHFPIYVASEGKNRVSLYRHLNRPIKALVFQSEYPPAENLELIYFQPFGIPALRYIGKDTEISSRLTCEQKLCDTALLPFGESVELLTAYGVKWGKAKASISAYIKSRKLKIETAHHFYIG